MKAPIVQPYLNFNGRCEEALEFYKTALGAEVQQLIRFEQSPEPMPPGMMPEGWGKKVMHVDFRVGESVLLASDGCGSNESFQGICLCIGVATVEEAERCFAALAEGGQVTMPLEKTFWTEKFGMVADRFGLGWMIHVLPAQA